MKYRSTRGGMTPQPFCDILLEGLAPDGGLTHSPVGRWVRNKVAPKQVVLKADSWVVLRNMAAAGLGVAVLPCFLAEPSPLLQRLAEAPDATSQLWILTHAEWRHSARVKAFMQHVATSMRRHRDLVEGKAASLQPQPRRRLDRPQP